MMDIPDSSPRVRRTHRFWQIKKDCWRYFLDKIKNLRAACQPKFLLYIAKRHSLLYCQGAALSLFIILTLGSAFWFRSVTVSGEGGSEASSTTSEDLYAAAPPAGQFSPLPTYAAQWQAGLFIDSRDRITAPSLMVVQNSSLLAAAPPVTVQPQVLAALVGVTEEEISGQRRGIVEYAVETGDSLSSIAAKFDLSLETLAWANELSKNSVIQPGQTLVILPVDGLVHHVKDGDTPSGIAKLYGAKIDDLLAFNDLGSGGQIYIGDLLIVPGGKMPVKTSSSSIASAPAQVPVASSYFISPVGASYRLTQGLHWYNAVDFDTECGNPIRAAAEGQVLKVATTGSTSRWAFGGAGNHITILHPNGVVTFYGHIRTALVSQGQPVSQGTMIATAGGLPGTSGAGLSTGCHLHFGVQGAKNPFAR